MANFAAAKKNISARFKEDFKFVKGWLKSPSAVGAIKPTGKVAAKHMAGLLPLDTGFPILELGPGTGVITEEILKRGVPGNKIISIEYSKDFLDFLVKKYPSVSFLHGDAFDLDKSLKDVPFKTFAGIIGAIPLLNVSRDERVSLIENSLKRVHGNGPFIQICYGPQPPVKAVSGKFTVEKSDLILRNIPPASVWVYRKDMQ